VQRSAHNELVQLLSGGLCAPADAGRSAASSLELASLLSVQDDMSTKPTMLVRVSFALGAAVLSLSPDPSTIHAQSTRSAACDFSRYRPLRLDHIPPECVRTRVEPEYPALGKEVRITGTVVVRVLINREGDVVMACVVSGHPILRTSALNAARQFKFQKNFCLGARQGRRYIETRLEFRFVSTPAQPAAEQSDEPERAQPSRSSPFGFACAPGYPWRSASALAL
jgi:TonB family protein